MNERRTRKLDEGLSRIIGGALALGALVSGCDVKDRAVRDRAPQQAAAISSREGRAEVTTKKATFGAGCFWGVEAEFGRLEGVVSTAVGYSGGTMPDPTYRDVCTGRTGHAEVVEVEYDPSRISYEKLLDAFWSLHDPTTPNRQGPDFGTQYRSAIFFHHPEEEAIAKASRDRLEASGKLKRKIVTEITPASPFYRAEEYHQRYLEKNGISSCPSSGH